MLEEARQATVADIVRKKQQGLSITTTELEFVAKVMVDTMKQRFPDYPPISLSWLENAPDRGPVLGMSYRETFGPYRDHVFGWLKLVYWDNFPQRPEHTLYNFALPRTHPCTLWTFKRKV
ncbi:hypothetical protein VKT23_007399 [Stygiomarasmius scandens]|uniref:Uncharacterized protein n=1 Tax=Marasmiellus scandens TaxID=2682957 RepID=A0ABR1JL00_9AGAR